MGKQSTCDICWVCSSTVNVSSSALKTVTEGLETVPPDLGNPRPAVPCSSSQRGISSGGCRIWHASKTDTILLPNSRFRVSATTGEGNRRPVFDPATVCNTTTHAGSAASALRAAAKINSS